MMVSWVAPKSIALWEQVQLKLELAPQVLHTDLS